MSARARSFITAAAVALAAAMLSSCSQIPTSGPIEQGPSVIAPGGEQGVRVIARPPSPGLDPVEIVRGFQEATASQDTGFAVARQYLTDGAARVWDPSEGVRVYDNTGLALEDKGGTVVATGVLNGVLDDAGQYTVASPGSTLDVEYGVVRVRGEWRIATLPPGLVLGRGDIDRGYRSFDLYYLTRDLTTLVPAPVTIPLTTSAMATQLVRGLLAGPTSWIAPAVRTAFPEGTTLTLDSVPVLDGVASVDLSEQVLSADDAARRALSAQLVWTLSQLPDVSLVRITVNGQPFVVPGAGADQTADAWQSFDPSAYPDSATAYAVGDRGVLFSVDPRQRLAVAGRLSPVGLLPGLAVPTAGTSSTKIAALSTDRRRVYEYVLGAVVQPGQERYAGTELSRPSYDRGGGFWTVDRGKGLLLVRGDTVTPVPVSGLPDGMDDGDLVGAAVSRDGTRMALLVQRGSRVEPMVARVERGADRVRVAAPRRVDQSLTESLDLVWGDANTLVVLGSSGSTSLEVLRFSVGTATVRRVGAPVGAVTIAAAPGRAMLVGAAGKVYVNSGASWNLVGVAADPTYPG